MCAKESTSDISPKTPGQPTMTRITIQLDSGASISEEVHCSNIHSEQDVDPKRSPHGTPTPSPYSRCRVPRRYSDLFARTSCLLLVLTAEIQKFISPPSSMYWSGVRAHCLRRGHKLFFADLGTPLQNKESAKLTKLAQGNSWFQTSLSLHLTSAIRQVGTSRR
jgi:hypothetical protein